MVRLFLTCTLLVGCTSDFPAPPMFALETDGPRAPEGDALPGAERDAAPRDATRPPDMSRPTPPEECDGVDQDGDGVIDEAVALRPCPRQAGVCQNTFRPCRGGAYQDCDYAELTDQPYTEDEGLGFCDGVDNDCDETVDEGCACAPGDDAVCGSDLGECEPGRQLCMEGQLGPCTGAIGPVDEICNQRDDDCDGDTDEALAGGDCPTQQQGRCAAGRMVCDRGDLKCLPLLNAAETDVCDGIDEDCDGAVDEHHAEERCESDGQGACAQGEVRCIAGAPTCVQVVEPVDEVQANDIDDDCDGATDERPMPPPRAFFDLADASVGGGGFRPGRSARLAAEGPIVAMPGQFAPMPNAPHVIGVFQPHFEAGEATQIAPGLSVDLSERVESDRGPGLHAKGPIGLVPDPVVRVPGAPNYHDRNAHSVLEIPPNYGITFDLQSIARSAQRDPIWLDARVGNSGDTAGLAIVLLDGFNQGATLVPSAQEVVIRIRVANRSTLTLATLDGFVDEANVQGIYFGDPLLTFQP